jgi:hypothetical protein
MNAIVAPKNVVVTFVAPKPVKAATKPEVQAVVSEVCRAINAWYYA